ncbi:MAG: hypothetical protein M5U15_06725, partial [Kiritimatiellae bacterium]|nr:hypothetical protein [Kiritimatiellia bacterium]
MTDLGVKWKTDHVRVAANGAEESTSQSSFDAKREAYVALSNNPISQIDPLGLVTLEECEQEFEDCNEGCRQMPNGTAAEKCARALCWGGCMASYGGCIARTREGQIGICVVVGAGIV